MQSRGLRPGPRSDVDTRQVLIETAERLFGDISVDGVSLRAVAREAGVAARAVTYHFPTKRDLVAAVIQRRSSGIGTAISTRLQLLASRRGSVAVREIVEAVVTPFLELFAGDPHGGLRWMKVFAALALAEDEIWAVQIHQDSVLVDDYLAASRKALLDSDSDDSMRRARIAMFNLISALAYADRAAYGHPLGEDGLDPAWVEQLVVYTSAGLQAP